MLGDTVGLPVCVPVHPRGVWTGFRSFLCVCVSVKTLKQEGSRGLQILFDHLTCTRLSGLTMNHHENVNHAVVPGVDIFYAKQIKICQQ